MLVLLAAAGVAVLVSLGVWQLNRLQWKEALIAERSERIKSPPVPFAEALARAKAGDDIDHLVVTLTGMFGAPVLRQFSTRGGPAGWELVSPFTTTEGHFVLVARGTLPDGEQALPRAPQGPVTIDALVRVHEGPGPFTPDNAPQNNQWFWWDVPAMARAAGAPESAGPVLTVDLAWPPPEGLKPLTPVMNLSNRHLGYALTWFGLAATLAGVCAAYLMAVRRAPPPAA